MELIKYVIENKDSEGFFLAHNDTRNIYFSKDIDYAIFNSEIEAENTIKEINKNYKFNLEVRPITIKHEFI